MLQPTIEQRIICLLAAKGPMPANDLRDEIIVELGNSRDFKIFRETEKKHGEEISDEIRRQLDNGSLKLVESFKLSIC